MASSGRRPLPQIVETKASPVQSKDDGSGSGSGGRRRTSSSVSKTSFNQPAEREKLNKLKKKMTFSDQSATSSAKSTPNKVVPHRHSEPRRSRNDGKGFLQSNCMTGPAKLGRKHRQKQSASLSPRGSRQSALVDVAPSIPTSYSYGGMTETQMERDAMSSDSDGGINSSISISSLLSKLDSIKSYLKEAEDMRVRFEEKKNEPGMMTQLKKLDQLIEQLQEQESGYLGELLRIMDLDNSKLDGSEVEEEEEEEEAYTEDETAEEVGQRVSTEEEVDEEEEDAMHMASRKSVKSGMKADGDEETLSLRAQMEQEKEAQLELMALKQQKQMLADLLEKQFQIQELEAKQVALLEMKNKAEQQLRDAENKGLELQKKSSETEEDRVTTEGAALMSKLSELRARKERMDKVSQLLDNVGNSEKQDMPPSTQPPKRVQQERVKPSGQNGGGGGRKNELVAEDGGMSGASMDRIAKLSKEANDVRRSIREAEQLIGIDEEENLNDQHSWRDLAHSKKEDEVAQKTKHTPSRDTDEEPKHSPTTDYKAKLSIKKEEILLLLKEREELRATHKRLLTLQNEMTVKDYLDEDSLHPNIDHDVHSQTDLTGATWGGSTVQSDPDEESASSPSILSDADADQVHEFRGIRPGVPVVGDGATLEQDGRSKTSPPAFMVTRHTPRVASNVRPRTISLDSTEVHNKSKKLKIEDKNVASEKPKARDHLLKPDDAKADAGKGGMFGNCGHAGFHGDSWAGVNPSMGGPQPPFSTSFGANQSLAGLTPFNVGKNWGDQRASNIQTEHAATLQQQLSLTSNMCSQLVQGQNSLIRAVCQRMDRWELQSNTQDQMTMLQQYQFELEAYYHRLHDSYIQLKEQLQQKAGDRDVPDSEEPVASALPTMSNQLDNEGLPSQPPPSTGVSFQMEPTAETDPWNNPQFGASAPPNPPESMMGPIPSFLPPPPTFPGNVYASPGFMPPEDYPTPASSMFGPYLSRMGYNPFPYEKSPFGHGLPQPFGCPPGGQYFYPNAPMMDPGASFDVRGNYVPGHLGFPGGPMGRGPGFDPATSPSGVTAYSLQVNAPTSPTSVPGATMPQNGEPPSNQQEVQSVPHSSTAAAVPTTVTTTTTTTRGAIGRDATAHSGGGGGGTEGASAIASAVEEKKGSHQEVADNDVDSMSSLPMSVPERSNAGEEPTTGFSVFDSLRDTIYSEVATFIASNESRPHFLVELFREMQMLTTDYLRQRALYSLQDLVTKFLTEETAGGGIDCANTSWLIESGSESDEGSSEVHSKPVLLNRPSQGYDYEEQVQSASSLSTPAREPFASDDLGDTVVKLDTAMARLRLSQMQAEGKDSLNISSHSEPQEESDGDKEGGGDNDEKAPFSYPMDMDTQALDEQIKNIMIDVIPLLKEHIDSSCSLDMVCIIRDRILNTIFEQEKGKETEYQESFQKQLYNSVTTVMEKYIDRIMRDCGEDMLMDVSEVLFNELAFFKMMRECSGQSQLGGFASQGAGIATSSETVGAGAVGSHVVQSGPTSEVAGRPKMLDPTLLQILSVSANLTLQEEEETLGKVRDDTLATTWDPVVQSQEYSPDDQEPVAVNVELSMSESRPVGSAGSGDEGEPARARSQPEEDEFEYLEGAATPPTPLANSSQSSTVESPHFYASLDTANKDVSIEKAASINVDEDEEDGGTGGIEASQQPALSPLASTTHPQITSLTESELDARMKAEQQHLEGVEGILTSMKEQAQSPDLDLVGDDNVTTPMNGI